MTAGSIPARWVEFVVSFRPASKVFLRLQWFSSLHKNPATFLNSNSTRIEEAHEHKLSLILLPPLPPPPPPPHLPITLIVIYFLLDSFGDMIRFRLDQAVLWLNKTGSSNTFIFKKWTTKIDCIIFIYQIFIQIVYIIVNLKIFLENEQLGRNFPS